jgi:NhaP-type Na+/H+ or K+/H+ antiporter
MITVSITIVIVLAIGLAFYRSVISKKDFWDSLLDFLWDGSIFICVGLFIVWAVEELIQFIQ